MSKEITSSSASSTSKSLQSIKFRPTDFVSHHVSNEGVEEVEDETTDAPRLPHSSNQSDERRHSLLEEKYEILKLVGRSRRQRYQSQVFLCCHKESGKPRAVKIWRKSKQQARKRRSSLVDLAAEAAFDEIDLDVSRDQEDEYNDKKMETKKKLTGSSHISRKKHYNNPELTEFYRLQELQQYPNIVELYELREGPTHYYMVLGYVGGGTLLDDLKHQPGERYPEDKAAMILMELLQAVSYLHSTTKYSHSKNCNDQVQQASTQSKQCIIHCDLNLSNILLDEQKDKISLLKLIDFGEAVCYSESDDNAYNSSVVDWHEPRGAQMELMAPEMFAWDQVFGPSCDLWSLGVIGYVMLSGRYPFGHENMTSTTELLQSIQERVGTLEGQDDKGRQKASSILFDARRSMIWNDVSDHAKDLILSLLQPNPEDRPTAEEALRHVWMEETRQRALKSKLAGGAQRIKEHGQVVWRGLKATARRRASTPKVLKQAALTLIASQLVLKDEKKYIDEIFGLMDVQADGVLSKDEVRKGYAEIFNKTLEEKDLDTLFAKVDKSGAGTIDYAEFVVASLNEKQLLHTDKLDKAFSAFDTDNDGFITAEEIRPLLQSYLEEHDKNEHVEILESIIAQVDRDGDGRISKEEFMAMMLHSSNGRRRRNPQLATSSIRRQKNSKDSISSSMASSLTTSMLMTETPDVFASTTSSLSSSKRKSLWESSVQLTFRPEHIIGKREDSLKKYYDVGDYIQSGAFGAVYFCTHKESGAERAVKYVKKSEHEKENELILREFNILRSLDHPNILKMYELFDEQDHYEIVMDACRGGDLCDEIDKFGAIAEAGGALILHQVLMCVNYCHQRHIVHCDLKPDNILLEANKAINQIKIIDFGLAANLVGEEELREGSVDNGRIREKRGTLRFMAPEVLASDYGPKADVWACGVMAFLLLADRFPFDGQSRLEIIERIKQGLYSFSDPIWQTISADAKSFIRHTLTVDEARRLSAEEALQHRWIKSARDKVSKNFHNTEVCAAAEGLDNLKHFQAPSVLARATYAFIASQLLLKEEKAKIDEVFRVMDVSCDGKLSKQEVKRGYKEVFGCELNDEELDDLFDRVDMDSSGFLEYSEFVVAALGEKELFRHDNLKKAFNHFDTENRGYITRKGLHDVLSTFLSDQEGVDDASIGRIMKEVDRNGDGRITYNDFLAAMLNSADIPVSEPAKFQGLFNGFRRIFDPQHHHK